MATRKKPFALTAAALASAAAVVAATPDLMSARDLTIAAAPSPGRLSSASYELTALSDLSIQGLSDAYWFGWGGFVGCGNVNAQGQCTNVPADVYYPQLKNIYVDGYSGALYYIIDNVIDQFTADFDLDNYYFEVGSQNFGYPNAQYSGAGALIYVGIGEAFGTDSQIFQTAQTIFYYGVTNVVNNALVSLATALVPEVELGPLTVGGGILASLYYYGITPDQSFQANSIGLPAIWSYVSTALTGLIPTAAATPESAAAVTSLAAAAATVTDEFVPTAKAAAGADKVDPAAPSAEPSVAQTPGASSPADAAGEATGPTESGTDAGADAGASASGPTESNTPTDAKAPSGGAAADKSTPDKSTPDKSTPDKVTKPKAQNPFGKIASKIKSALGGDTAGKQRGDKSSTSASGSAAGSSSSDSGSDSGSDK